MQIVEAETKECKLIASKPSKKQKKDLHLNTFLRFELQISLCVFQQSQWEKNQNKSGDGDTAKLKVNANLSFIIQITQTNEASSRKGT
jgi:hypothetical protein